jgi:hypothetical protein
MNSATILLRLRLASDYGAHRHSELGAQVGQTRLPPVLQEPISDINATHLLMPLMAAAPERVVNAHSGRSCLNLCTDIARR